MELTGWQAAQAQGELETIKSMLASKISEKKIYNLRTNDPTGELQRRVQFDIDAIYKRQQELEGMLGQTATAGTSQQTETVQPTTTTTSYTPPPSGVVRGLSKGKPSTKTKAKKYVVRVSQAWRNSIIAQGKNPDDEIRNRVPIGASYSIQNV